MSVGVSISELLHVKKYIKISYEHHLSVCVCVCVWCINH